MICSVNGAVGTDDSLQVGDELTIVLRVRVTRVEEQIHDVSGYGSEKREWVPGVKMGALSVLEAQTKGNTDA